MSAGAWSCVFLADAGRHATEGEAPDADVSLVVGRGVVSPLTTLLELNIGSKPSVRYPATVDLTHSGLEIGLARVRSQSFGGQVGGVGGYPQGDLPVTR